MEKKKVYQHPATRVVELRQRAQLLTGSRRDYGEPINLSLDS